MDNELNVQNKIFGKTFFWMFLGLLGSAIIAWYTYSSGLFVDIVLGDYFSLLLILEVVVVLLFSFLFRKLSPTVVRNTVFCICNDKWCYFISYICCFSTNINNYFICSICINICCIGFDRI